MEPCVIAIPDSACFQAFWAEEAETGDAVRSHADSPIRCLDRKQEGAGWAEKVSKTSGVSAELKRSLCAAVFTGVDGCKNRFL